LLSPAPVIRLAVQVHDRDDEGGVGTGFIQHTVRKPVQQAPALPEYRLSKFQRALPDSLQVEMVGQYLVDFEGTEAFMRPLPK
jgi:hypothetical protein